MPTPTVPPPPKTRELPSNLDDLVRRAMRGGGIGALHKALAEPPGPGSGAPESGPSPAPAPGPDGEAEAAAEGLPEVTPAALPDPLDALVLAAEEARAAAGDPTCLGVALDRVEAALATARSLAPRPPSPPPEDGPPVRLPPARHPWALAIGAVPAGIEVGRLAAALEVDLATARAAVLAGGARIVLRAAERGDLDRRAAALAGLGLAARVLTRDDLLVAGPALGLVRAESLTTWRVVEASRWGENRPDPAQLPEGMPYLADPVRLVVHGEVEEKRLRAAPADSRWQRAHYASPNPGGTEARIAVYDLHTEHQIVRVVEGAADLSALPAAAAGAQRRSLKALVDGVLEAWPQAHLEPRRTFPAVPRSGDALRADGWATFEEHTRVCRALSERS